MASTEKFTWGTWALYDSDAATTYSATGSVIVNRQAGSDEAILSGSMTINAIGGDMVPWRLHFEINGTDYYQDDGTLGNVIHYEGTVKTMTITKSIPVGTNAGTAEVKLWLEILAPERYYGRYSEVKTATLNYQSKGYSEIISVSKETTLGNPCEVRFKPLSKTFYYRISFKFGGFSTMSELFNPNTLDEFMFNWVPLLINEKTLAAIPNSPTATMTVTLHTFSSESTSDYIGSDSKTCTVRVPKTCLPTIDKANVAMTEAATVPMGTNFIANYSKIRFSIPVSSEYQATIKSAAVEVEGVIYPASMISNGIATITTGTIKKVGSNIPAKITCTDSRGYSKSETVYYRVDKYSRPWGTLDVSQSGTTITVDVSLGGSPNHWVRNETVEYNLISYTLKREKLSTQEVVTVRSGSGIKASELYYSADGCLKLEVLETIEDSTTESYKYTLTVRDNARAIQISKSTGVICISRLAGGHGVSFFREATASDNGRVAVAGDFLVEGAANIKMNNLIKTKLVSTKVTNGIAAGSTFVLSEEIEVDEGYKAIGIATYNMPSTTNVSFSSLNITANGVLIIRGRNNGTTKVTEANSTVQVRVLEIYTG